MSMRPKVSALICLWEHPLFWVTLVWASVYLYPFLRACVLDQWVFCDPDTYMRLYRIEDLAQGGAWFNPSIQRIGTDPSGFALHWTRLLDILLFGGTYLLKFWVPSERALVLVASFLNAFWPWVGALVLCQGCRYVLTPRCRLIAGLLVLTEGWMLGYASPFHPDHHSLLACCTIVSLGLICKQSSPSSQGKGYFLGFVCALGLWVSFEWLLTLGILWVGLMIGSFRDQKWGLFLERALQSAFMWLVLFLFIERGSAWTSLEHDRLSWVHGGVVLMLWVITKVVFCVNILRPLSYVERWLVWSAVSVGCVWFLFVIYPPFLGGFAHVIDPRIEPIWHDHVSEIIPLFKGEERWAVLVYALGHPLMGLTVVMGVLWGRRNDPGSFPIFLIPSAIGLCFYIPFAFYQIRHALFSQVFGILPLVYGVESIARKVLQPALRGGTIACVLLMPVLGGFFLAPPSARVFTDTLPEECRDWNQMMASLRALREKGAPSLLEPSTLFLTTLGVESTRILFETPWRILGVPYHRNVEGICASYGIFSASTLEKGLASLHEHGVHYILFAQDHLKLWMASAHVPVSAFYHHLLSVKETPFLRRISLPDPLEQRFTLIQVRIPPSR